MAVRAVIELSARHGRAVAKPLLHHIYRSSALGTVGIVLSGIEWRTIDDLIDDAVHQLPLTIPGLRYFAMADRALPAAIAGAGLIFASTRLFRGWLGRQGIARATILPVRRVPALLPCAGASPTMVRPGREGLACA